MWPTSKNENSKTSLRDTPNFAAVNDAREVVVYIVDFSLGAFSYIGASIQQLLGYSPQEIYEKGPPFFFRKIHEKDYPRLLTDYANNLEKTASENSDKRPLCIFKHFFRIQSFDRNWTWVENSAFILDYDENQKPQTGLGILKLVNPKFIPEFSKKINLVAKKFRESHPPANLSTLSRYLKRSPENGMESPAGKRLLEIAFQPYESLNISHREREVLNAIGEGLSSKEIAGQLFISETTVVTHRKNLMQKFQARNTAELIKKASKIFWFE
ncbi:MAG: PAS domain-containing protein [Lewinellaceae bacterium]|nr:PAS domain-containing protein [Phaeodactylibacter sp.]MCB9352153.1 PAS domain-containing protein [Lewinellaceae bacterium]